MEAQVLIDKARFLLLTTSLTAMVMGCDSHPADEHGASSLDPSSPYPACDAIIKACHEKDVGEGPVSACHGLAHDATGDDVCIPKKDECLKTCLEASVDAGVADATDGGG